MTCATDAWFNATKNEKGQENGDSSNRALNCLCTETLEPALAQLTRPTSSCTKKLLWKRVPDDRPPMA